MKHTHLLAWGLLAAVGIAGALEACVGDTEGTSDAGDATTDSLGNDVAPPKDAPATDGPTGCAARTADDTAGVFVAQSGSDVNSCGARANPCKTITYAIATAKAASGKTTIYVAAAPPVDGGPGAYVESITLDAPLTIEGGWKDSGGTWTPICDATTSTAVTIQGVTNTAISASYNGAATLRDLKVVSKTSAGAGESLYGIFASGATTTLTLDQVVVAVAEGGVGTDGTPGTLGAAGSDAGCTAGSGSGGSNGSAGAGAPAGTFSPTGYVSTCGADGGAAGNGSNGTAGGAGACSSTCETCTYNGTCSFGTKQVCGANGVSGCAGSAGGAGSFACSGGGSFGVYVWNAHVTVFGGSFASSNGGNGGSGGAAGDGGAGMPGAAGASAGCVTGMHCSNGCFIDSVTQESGGASGGAGGAGGTGGQGGGGSGGPSYAIVNGGDAGAVGLNGNPTLAHGDAGAGGANGGANGAAGNTFP